MVDRLLHHAEVIAIEGESYRLKEAKERTGGRRQLSWPVDDNYLGRLRA
jgi:hypothetical protein